ncbi:MAG TPA: efflux RND transporter periplasmic adaptor subunit [Geminicoccaceae bacterium]|nr:efflux RND transporter periplasmic adaptor subunit [Geminicoccaceae bacterium]
MATTVFEKTQLRPDRAERRPAPSRRRTVLWFAVVALLLALVGSGLYGFDRFRRQATADFFASQTPPPTPVAAAPAEAGPMPRYLDGIGTLTAVREVMVAPEVAGRVVEIRFEAGASVKRGDLLVQLNDAPERAELASFQARERLAQANLERTSRLIQRDFATQATLDENQALLEQARAGIAQSQAIIDQKLVKAPFDGELGIRRVELGQYVDPGTTLVTLTDLDRLYANFTLPEQDRAALAVGQQVELRADAFPGEVFPGEVTAIEPQVDPSTRVIRVQATLANPGHRLLPGMFANARVVLAPEPRVVSVPETAIARTLYGDSVFVVEEDGRGEDGKPRQKAVQTFVETGPAFEGRVAIVRGVEPGALVVSSGQLKLQNGAPVAVTSESALAVPATPPVQ